MLSLNNYRVPIDHVQSELRPSKQHVSRSNFLAQTLSERNIDHPGLQSGGSGRWCETFRRNCSPASERTGCIVHRRRGVATKIMLFIFRPSLPAEIGGRWRNEPQRQYLWCHMFGWLVLYLQRRKVCGFLEQNFKYSSKGLLLVCEARANTSRLSRN